MFHNQGKVYEIYAQNVHHSAMFGFIEVEKLLFGEKTSVVVDPTEENLKNEFNGVERTYIPMHSIIRIDEVEKQGTAKISEGNAKAVIAHTSTIEKNIFDDTAISDSSCVE